MKDNMLMQHKDNILEFRIRQQYPTLQQVHIPQLVHVENSTLIEIDHL